VSLSVTDKTNVSSPSEAEASSNVGEFEETFALSPVSVSGSVSLDHLASVNVEVFVLV
jgi:hypothetical protein